MRIDLGRRIGAAQGRRTIAVCAAIAMVAAGCRDEPAAAPKDAGPKRGKTEMEFLAQYEKLGTRSCPPAAPRCLVPALATDDLDAATKFEACIERAMNRATRILGPAPTPGSGADAWHTRFAAAQQRMMDGCVALLPRDAGLGYGRGPGAPAIPSAVANATSSPVDVVID